MMLGDTIGGVGIQSLNINGSMQTRQEQSKSDR